MKTTGNNGLKTPAGFTVGMNIADVIRLYGAGRNDDDSVGYGADWWKNIAFKHKDGKITEICIYPTP